MTTRSLRLLAGLSAVLVIGVAAPTAGAASRVRVPHVSGELTHAYGVLHRAGLRVTIARPFTVRSDASTVIRSVSPQAGTHVARGSVVKLTVVCCQHARHPKVPIPLAVPDLVGHSLATASSFAARDGRLFTASLGALHAGGASGLLLDYRVSRQTPDGGRTLTGAQRLVVSARQGTQAPCTPPLFAVPYIHDAVASVSLVPTPSVVAERTGIFYGCVLKTGRQVRLASTSVTNDHDFTFVSPALANTELAVATATGGGKYGSAPDDFGIETYNVATGQATKVYDAGTDVLDQVVVNATGFTAWHQVRPPTSTSTPFTDVACPTASMCVATDKGGSVFTTTSPSGGRSAWVQTKLPGANSLTGVACVTPTNCVAVGGDQAFATTNPGGGAAAWTATVIPGADLSAVACPSASLCVAVGANGIATSTAPSAGTWTFGTVPTVVALASLACPSTALCVAADGGSGNVVTTTAPSGGAANWSVSDIDGSQALSAVSCASVAFCVVDDPAGDVLTSGNPSGGLPAWQLSHVVNTALERIACPSDSLCVAATLNGIATSVSPTGGPGAWNQAQIPGGNGITGVSCPTVNLCVAVNQQGQITTSANPTGGTSAWGAATVDAPACAAGAGCATEQIGAHDSSGLRTLDTTGPGSGTQLQSLTLTDNQLTWTHDGAPESATLG